MTWTGETPQGVRVKVAPSALMSQANRPRGDPAMHTTTTADRHAAEKAKHAARRHAAALGRRGDRTAARRTVKQTRRAVRSAA